ncbi:MAG: polysaccharide deacetylase family protein [Oligoflexia bacterium]|nr:polysaccharide deacetylase family protein [Oligoflexia bacterium]
MFKIGKRNIISFTILILCGVVVLQCQVFDKISRNELSQSMEISRGLSSANCSASQNGAIVVMYHRFDGKYPSTSVTKDLLQQHLNFFRSNDFNIIPLEEVVRAVEEGINLPPKTLAITVDDAYRSAYEIAHPLFLKYKAPYTVFVNTKAVDQNIKDYMSWNQLRQISQSDLVDLEAHSHAHAYMIRELNFSQREQDIKTSVIRIYQETNHLPKYFAYPYGETSNQFINEVKNYRWNIGGHNFKFLAAFTTQSGPIGCSSSMFALPRFALNMNYGKMNDLFRYKMMSRHFPIQSFSPQDLAFCASRKIQKFSLKSSHLALNGLNCFASNGGAGVKMKNPGEIDILLNQPFIEGLRQRINCTLPAGGDQFFWFGKEFSILEC